MSLKQYLAISAAMASMFGGGIPNHLRTTYIPPSNPIPFTFKKFKHKFGEDLPKGCKKEKVKLEFIKPSSPIKYKITVDVDVIYGTIKSGKKKLLQYQNEIAYFIYHTQINIIRNHSEDILIEEVNEN